MIPVHGAVMGVSAELAELPQHLQAESSRALAAGV